jgi:hypothetical protein
MGRQRKNPDEEYIDPKDQTIVNQQEQLMQQSQMMQTMADRMARLEAVVSQNKLRKWDEMNDADALQKRGIVPSFDGKDPIISLSRSGKAWIDANMIPRDEQYFEVKSYSGREEKIGLLEAHSVFGGNEIQCVVNDWDDCVRKQQEIDKKRAKFQKSAGKGSKFSTVDLLKEIKKDEEELTINVTLSEDYGKTFTGLTLDIPFQTVFNAWL